jgi:hypothetical protein
MTLLQRLIIDQPQALMMAAETVSETLGSKSILTWTYLQRRLSAFNRSENFGSYKYNQVGKFEQSHFPERGYEIHRRCRASGFLFGSPSFSRCETHSELNRVGRCFLFSEAWD